MRSHLLGLILLAGAAVPAAAQQAGQQPDRIDRRVEKLEQELRAVQRRVFPGGNVEPEISSAAQPGQPAGLPASSAVADLNARLDAIEAQLAALTGRAETSDNRLRLVEEGLTRLRTETASRLDAVARPPAAVIQSAPAPATIAPSRPDTSLSRAVTAAAAPVSVARPAASEAGAEEAYNVGFRLWDRKRYGEAQRALEEVGRRYPRSKWASWANNLAGRAYLDEGKPATAARMFLANYQGNPRGERAADSLFYLGQALMTLNKPADACKAYDELQDVYGNTMREFLKQSLPAARREAHCR